jgi:hypothetical protein
MQRRTVSHPTQNISTSKCVFTFHLKLSTNYVVALFTIHKSRGSKTSLTRHLIWSSCTKIEKWAVMYFVFVRGNDFASFYHFFTFLFLYKTLFNCLHASDYLVQLFNWKQMNILSTNMNKIYRYCDCFLPRKSQSIYALILSFEWVGNCWIMTSKLYLQLYHGENQ